MATAKKAPTFEEIVKNDADGKYGTGNDRLLKILETGYLPEEVANGVKELDAPSK